MLDKDQAENISNEILARTRFVNSRVERGEVDEKWLLGGVPVGILLAMGAVYWGWVSLLLLGVAAWAVGLYMAVRPVESVSDLGAKLSAMPRHGGFIAVQVVLAVVIVVALRTGGSRQADFTLPRAACPYVGVWLTRTGFEISKTTFKEDGTYTVAGDGDKTIASGKWAIENGNTMVFRPDAPPIPVAETGRIDQANAAEFTVGATKFKLLRQTEPQSCR